MQGQPDALYQIADAFEDHSLDRVSACMGYLPAFRRSRPEFSHHEFIVSALDQLKTRALKPIVGGWANYIRHLVAKRTLSIVSNYLYRRLEE